MAKFNNMYGSKKRDYISIVHPIYPTDEQRDKISEIIEICKTVRNMAVEYKNSEYDKNGENITYFDLCKKLTDWKKENQHFYNVYNTVLRNQLWTVDLEYQKFFNNPSIGRPEPLHYHPTDIFSYSQSGWKLKENNTLLYLSKIGDVKIDWQGSDGYDIEDARVVSVNNHYESMDYYNKNWDTDKVIFFIYERGDSSA